MNDSRISPVTTPGLDGQSSARPGRGYEAQPPVDRTAKPSKKRTFLAAVGVTAGLAIFSTGLAYAANARAAEIQPAKATPVVVAYPGPITTPAGTRRCTKPGQYHLTLDIRSTATLSDGRHWAGIGAKYRGKATVIGEATSERTLIRVIGCLTPRDLRERPVRVDALSLRRIAPGRLRMDETSYLVRLAH